MTDNLRVTPVDYSPYCVTAPSDPRLPDGGGYQVCGLYDISGRSSAQVDNLVRLADDFGEDKEIYNGVDVSLNARLPRGVVVQGGTSTGRTLIDSCYVVDSPQALRNCKVAPPFQTQIKLIGVYPLPWGGIQTSATFQSLPGPQITRQPRLHATPRSCRRSGATSRRAGAATCNGCTVQLIDPGTMYGDRLNQVDFRLSKIFRMPGGRRIQANMDLFNMFNVERGARAEQHLRTVLAPSDQHHPGPPGEVRRPDRFLAGSRADFESYGASSPSGGP